MTTFSPQSITCFVPRRSDDEITFAEVEAQVDDNFVNEPVYPIGALFDAIRAAVTRWYLSTERGRSVIRANHFDFNLGDLAEWKDDDSLASLLRERGIRSISITLYSDTTAHSWEFDDLLFDETEIVGE